MGLESLALAEAAKLGTSGPAPGDRDPSQPGAPVPRWGRRARRGAHPAGDPGQRRDDGAPPGADVLQHARRSPLALGRFPGGPALLPPLRQSEPGRRHGRLVRPGADADREGVPSPDRAARSRRALFRGSLVSSCTSTSAAPASAPGTRTGRGSIAITSPASSKAGRSRSWRRRSGTSFRRLPPSPPAGMRRSSPGCRRSRDSWSRSRRRAGEVAWSRRSSGGRRWPVEP